MTALQKHAYHYTERLGLALVPIPNGMKGPRENGWNRPENTVRDGATAHNVFKRTLNMGVLHSASDTGTLDIDHQEWAALALAAIGYDLAALQQWPTRIKGKNGEKPFFRLGGRQYDRHSIAWPHPTEKQKDKAGNPTDRPLMVTLFELRAGAVQDVLPPSIHPDSGKPYEWAGTPPRRREDIPMISDELCALWENWEALVERMQAACPWRDVMPTPKHATYEGGGGSIKGERPGDHFQARVNIREVLERNGYKPQGGRYLPPGASSKMAGVRILKGEDGIDRAFSDHGSCPLNDHRAHDSFSALILLEHTGDVRAAARAAAQELGLERPEPTPEFTEPPLDAARSAQLWDQHETDLLERAMQHLAALPIHHNMRDALVNLLAWTYHSAGEGNLTQTKDGMVLSVGGMKQFAAVIGGRSADCKARLSWLADHGMISAFRAIDPTDPNSGRVIVLPADPLSLPFLAYLPNPNGPVQRPQTHAVRHSENVYPTPCKESLAKAGGSVNIQNRNNPLRALVSLALTLSKHPGLSLEKLAQLTGIRLPTIRKRLSLLAELDYLTSGGSLRCTFQQFFADMRAWGAEQAGRRLTTTLERQRDYAKRGLMLARFGVEEFKAKAGRMRQMFKAADAKLTRLSDGEMPHSVLGRAA